MDCSDKVDDFEVFQLYTAILAALDYTAAATAHNLPAVVAVHMMLAVVWINCVWPNIAPADTATHTVDWVDSELDILAIELDTVQEVDKADQHTDYSTDHADTEQAVGRTDPDTYKVMLVQWE